MDTIPGIYRYEDMIGSTRTIDGIKVFMSVLPDGIVHIEEIPKTLSLQFVAKTWPQVLTDKEKDPFTPAHWRSDIEEWVEFIYDDLMDEFADDLDMGDIYADDDDEAILPWNKDVIDSARRVAIRYILESEWSKTMQAQERAIAFVSPPPSHDKVVNYHYMLYLTKDITNHTKHRKARFLASSVQAVIEELKLYRKGKYADVRRKPHSHWRS
jgi:hypothetical protein